MKRYSEQEIRKIKEIRLKNKFSYAYISRLKKIPQTTIGHWFRADEKISKDETLLQNNIRIRKKIKNSEISLFNEIALGSVNNARLWSAIMYWCEGAKYPASNAMRMANSDPNMLRTFVCLLRKGFMIDESKFYLHLQIHTNQNYENLKKYWSTLLGISLKQFIKPTITRPTGKKHKVDYKGTCTVKYQDYRLQLKLIGLYEEFTRKIGDTLGYNKGLEGGQDGNARVLKTRGSNP